jgi:hypothetical protein
MAKFWNPTGVAEASPTRVTPPDALGYTAAQCVRRTTNRPRNRVSPIGALNSANGS